MKLMKYVLLAVATAWILSGCTVQVTADGLNACRYEEERSATVPADGVKNLIVLAGAGSLRVEGRSDLTEVRVHGTACATTENLVRQVDLRAEKVGDAIRVETRIPSSIGQSPYLDLTLEVPESMVARLEDSSGDLEVRRIAGVDLVDESGSIDLIDITGAIRVRDDSGDLEVRNAGGDLTIPQDGSGSIRIQGVKGSVIIDRDDSGDITVADVAGNVTIGEDGSGSIDVRDVRGDFTVRRDGSGGIKYNGVNGRVAIPSK